MKTRPVLAALAAALLATCAVTGAEIQADTTQTDTTADVGAARQDPAAAALLSAFFGLDNGLPLPTNARICRGAGGAASSGAPRATRRRRWRWSATCSPATAA